jgi:hypothetical protein
MPIQTQAIGYRDGDTELTGLLAWDDPRAHRGPGILVVHGGAASTTMLRGERGGWRSTALSHLLAICTAMALPAIANE